MKKIIKIKFSPMVGENGFFQLRDQLDEFVRENFPLFYEGATRLGYNIPSDYYAPQRVQIRETRLHETIGLKYASGHKYNDTCAPTGDQLRETVADLQVLLDAAGENIPKPFSIYIKGVKNEKNQL